MFITHSVWTQLENKSEWIYFIPSRDSITILCPDKEPIDIALHGAGKLSIQAGCKGYSQSALLQTTSVIQVNTSKFGGDLLSKVQSHYDCGENLGNSKYYLLKESPNMPSRLATSIQEEKTGVVFWRVCKIASSDYQFRHYVCLSSVCLSVRMEQLASHWTDFYEISYLSIFLYLSRKFKFH
jgi:hypothetical protein